MKAWPIFGVARFVQSLLFGVDARDPLTFAFTATLLGVVALVACLVPAFRATRVDPVMRFTRSETVTVCA